MGELPKVLVVDDEKDYLDDFLSLFSRKAAGRYEVLTAAGGTQALEILAREPIAVVVSDQRMPQMSGSELLSQVAKLHPGTVRILLTGYSDIDAVIEAVNKGEIYRYVSKDLPLKEIEIVIQQGLEKNRTEEQNRQLLRAKKQLLKSLAAQENLSVVGTFGQQIHQRLEALVMNLFNYVFQMDREKDEKGFLAEFQRLQGALGRLRELSSFSEKLRPDSPGTERGQVNLIVQEAAERARKQGAELLLDLAPVLPEIPIHRYSLNRALKELIENGLLFGPKQGKKVTIRTRYHEAAPGGDEESCIRIEIEDNGGGIPASEIPKTFAPFYTTFQTAEAGGAAPASEEYNLTPNAHYGFGLPIAQWIIGMRFNGTVELASETGKGTKAIVTLPVP